MPPRRRGGAGGGCIFERIPLGRTPPVASAHRSANARATSTLCVLFVRAGHSSRTVLPGSTETGSHRCAELRASRSKRLRGRAVPISGSRVRRRRRVQLHGCNATVLGAYRPKTLWD